MPIQFEKPKTRIVRVLVKAFDGKKAVEGESRSMTLYSTSVGEIFALVTKAVGYPEQKAIEQVMEKPKGVEKQKPEK